MASGVGPGDSPASEKAGIWVVSMFGGTPRQLRADADGAVVSPDDRHIAFRTTKGSPEIWVMDAEGGGARRLAAAGPREHFGKLQWSADARFLAYMRYGTERGKEVVIEARPLDGDQTSTVLVEPGLRTFCWVPDGRIVFSRRSAPTSADMNLWELKVNSRNGRAAGKPQQVTQWAGFVFTDMSVTADSKRLVFIKEAQQTNVYVAALDARAASLPPPARLTLDEWTDSPSAWTRDGKAVLFYSDRNGSWNIFQQALGEPTPEPLVSGPADQLEPRLSPDGAWILYWNKPAEGAAVKLMRMPVHGGAAESVLDAGVGARFRCAARPDGACIVSEVSADGRQLTFSAFDPHGAKGPSLASLAAAAKSEWDLSPDGATLAVLDPEDSARLRLVSVSNGSTRYLTLHSTVPAGTVAWAPDAQSLFIVSGSVRGSALLSVDLNGNARELWTGKSLTLSAPVPSPDGSHIAFAGSTARTNVWLIENF